MLFVFNFSRNTSTIFKESFNYNMSIFNYNFVSLFSIICAIFSYLYTQTKNKTQIQKNIEPYDDQQIYKEMELSGLTF